MTLIKIPVILAAVAGIHIGFTPPQPVPSAEESNKYDSSKASDSVPNVGTWGPKSIRILITCVEIWETWLILCREYPTLRQTLSHVSRSEGLLTSCLLSKLSLSPIFLIGTILIALGAYIRIVCFRLLGRHFTFQLSVQNDHKLITNGPYTVVRHPSYSGALMQVIGLLLCLTSKGSWWREYQVWRTPLGMALTLVVALQMALCVGGGIDRCYKEDVVMRDLFPSEWDEWAKKTHYRLIPFLF